MRCPEQRRGDEQGNPAAAEFLEPAEQDAAEHHFLRDRRKDGRRDQRLTQPLEVARADDPVDSHCAGNRHGDGKYGHAAGQAQRQVPKRLGIAIVVVRMLAQPGDHEPIEQDDDREGDQIELHGGGEAGDRREQELGQDPGHPEAEHQDDDGDDHRHQRKIHDPPPQRTRRGGSFDLCHEAPPVSAAVEPNGRNRASAYSTRGSSGAADWWPSAASSLRLRSSPPA